MDEPEILFERRGRLGLVTLNRPKALNALTWGMVRALDARLDEWAEDDGVAVVAIRGAGERAFAAGGDIRWLYENGQGGTTGEKNFRFFWEEYRLNTKIKRYPKPYVGLMHGVIMGGGVGVSIHGSFRIATEGTVFAMPETGIGLFPDVGATFFLPRLPGETGMWLGLTGARLKGEEVAAVGLVDAFLPAVRLDALIDRLAAWTEPHWRYAPGDLSWLYRELEGLEPASAFRPASPVAEIDAHFGGASVEAILDSLSAGQTEWGRAQRDTILAKSPSSTRIAYRQIREGARLSFEDCMRLEYRLARYCMTHPDFYEGVRAVILDKDNAPKWSPPTLDAASDAVVADAFADLGADELELS